MPHAYRADLAQVHDVGFGAYAENAARFVVEELRRRGIRRGLVVDLGCGSGVLAERVAAAGYDVLGVDLSPSMVAIAKRRLPRARFRVGSFVDAALPRCVAVTAVGEVVNYTFDRRNGDAAFARLVRRVKRALEPGGIFVLDALEPGHVAGNGTRLAHREGDGWAVLATIVEDRRRRRLTRTITTFLRIGGRWRRDHEVHRQRLVPRSSIAQALRAAGLGVRVLSSYGTLQFGRGHAGFLASRPRAEEPKPATRRRGVAADAAIR